MSDYQHLVLNELGNGVFEIRLDRPERLNALGVVTATALEHAVTDLTAKGARVLLLCGNGRAFCAGADLKERKGMDLAGMLRHNANIRAAIESIASAHFVTIAVINGLAMGGGVELALACDMRIAMAGISLGLTESRVGALPGGGGTQRLPRIIGVARALQLMLVGEPVTSEYALAIGLVNEVLPEDELDGRAIALATTLASRSAPALAAIKGLVYRGMDLPLDAALRFERAALPEILGSTDYAEGLTAFAERRQPRFKEAVPERSWR
jgi:enoyl-CoA hydratase/carnithine racemase